MRGKRDIARLFRQASKRCSCPGMALRACSNQLPYSRVLLSPVKSVGKAVWRNRVKRWMRHDYAAVVSGLKTGYDIALLVYPTRQRVSHRQLSTKLTSLLRQAELLPAPAPGRGQG